MALYYDLPIYKSSYRLVLLLAKIIRTFPRDYRYSLGQDIQNRAIDMVRCIYLINSSANESNEKKEGFGMFSQDLELLKLELRLAFDLQLLSPSQQTNLRTELVSIGKQSTAWRKQQRKEVETLQ